ncbi:hypothetical protein PSTT_11438 [Puccinia striiformis]|uniref:DDE Tnp4 domain-containing protein n=1 Tax=Puccinia striiformis TaxID=27350 RepID=A0A2S4V0D8_9BASI|nr:hypothetical protein PSTT_11438 [Puccinia striiformis]
MHDSCVFRISRIGQSVNPNVRTPPIIPPGTFLVGDAGYPGNMDIFYPTHRGHTPERGTTLSNLQLELWLNKRLGG